MEQAALVNVMLLLNILKISETSSLDSWAFFSKKTIKLLE